MQVWFPGWKDPLEEEMKGINFVDSLSKGFNLEPFSKRKQYHLHSGLEEAGMTILSDLYYFSDGRGWVMKAR